MAKTATVTLPNRIIRGGEYGAAYGACKSHEQIFLEYFRASKTMQVASASTESSVVVTIKYTGKMSQRQLLEIERFYQAGFLLDLVY